MHFTDGNLLLALEALLREGSVLGAARRMHLSPPAMSRTLQRLRDATGDPILVRAGRRMVPTPRATAMRQRVFAAADEMRALLGKSPPIDLGQLERAFTIRTSDYLLTAIGGALDLRVRQRAPHVRLVVLPEGAEDVEALRSGDVDLDIGVQGELGPELRTRRLFDDTMVGIVRDQHPLHTSVTADELATVAHVAVSRRGKAEGHLDRALAALGLTRRVERVVPSFFAAAWLAATSELLAVVPERFARRVSGQLGLTIVSLGVTLPLVPVSIAWHPRYDGDAAHSWLRNIITDAAITPSA